MAIFINALSVSHANTLAFGVNVLPQRSRSLLVAMSKPRHREIDWCGSAAFAAIASPMPVDAAEYAGSSAQLLWQTPRPNLLAAYRNDGPHPPTQLALEEETNTSWPRSRTQVAKHLARGNSFHLAAFMRVHPRFRLIRPEGINFFLVGCVEALKKLFRQLCARTWRQR
jgi:hypothetical protein